METDLRSDTKIGLRIEQTLEQPAGGGPLIISYIYILDTVKFKKWLEDHAYLCEGPLGFTVKGVRILLEAGAEKWDKAGFSIDNDGEPFFLNLLRNEEIFKVHRDMFNKKEWSITYHNPVAARSQTYG